jgi:hypothetical protein
MAQVRHAGRKRLADLERVTAVAAHPWARPVAAVAPVPRTALTRVTGTLHEPNTWTVGIMLATGIVLLARHPIAHLLGTEPEATPAPVVATNPVDPHTAPAAPSLALSAAVPTHAPRDPFRALVNAGGKVLAPQTQPVAAVPAASSAPAPVVAVPTTTCTGTTHRVVAGDTLWTIAARAVRSNDTDRVTLAWHRVYAANRGTLGSNPALLQVGAKLCVPTSI